MKEKHMREPLVLIIEDEPTVGTSLQLILNSRKIGASWIVGLQPENPFEGATIHALLEGDIDVDLCLANYAVALVDGDLRGGGLQGWEIVPLLVEYGITVVAISGSTESQAKLVAAGAQHQRMKPTSWMDWVDNELQGLLKLWTAQNPE
jgi:CheY-like chemotaxis protein